MISAGFIPDGITIELLQRPGKRPADFHRARPDGITIVCL